MACGNYISWVVIVLLGVVAFRTVSCGDGTPCKVLCDNGAEMISCGSKTEIFNCCGPCREPTCDNPLPSQDCEGGCKAGCFCRNGYIRQHADGPCVPIASCKKAK
uniref:TIL domain-containing protein n=1 Tax=Anopheles epiroticus TaxID=199890 RepID=A0A182P3T4_9DIPT